MNQVSTARSEKKSNVDVLSDLAPDMRRCIAYLLYYGDVTDDAFHLLVQQMRPFGVQVIVYPRRTSVHHLEERGDMGHFMGSGHGPSMDWAYITKGTGATVRQYQHVETPLVCLEMHAARMHCAGANAEVLTEQREAEHLAIDQASLAPFERGVFEVTDLDLNEFPPYQNDAFIQHVKDIGTFNHVRAPAGAATVAAHGRNVSWSEVEHPRLSKLHNQPGRALPNLVCPGNEWPAGTARSPPPEPALVFSRDSHRHTHEVASDVVAQTCECLLTLHRARSGSKMKPGC